jgi:uncharacterized membrane protein YozB (DUF420 family)
MHIRSLRIIAAFATLLIALAWLGSSTLKLVDLRSFADIVLAHDVLPESTRWMIPFLPWTELLIAFLLVASRERTRFRSVALASSACLLAFFLIYLRSVDPATLAKVGCGCAGNTRASFDRTGETKLIVLLALHLVAASAFLKSDRTTSTSGKHA